MSEPASACYVYCVVPADGVPPLDDLTGVDPRFGVGAVALGELCALASRVRLEQFGADALRRNLEDIAWVERTARAHDAVLTRALHADAVVPLRLCTIFADADQVRAMLARERVRLATGLQRLRGRVEWSVKALADRSRLEAAVRERGPAPAVAVPSGRAFFERKQADRDLLERTRALAATVVEEIHARLSAEADAATRLPPQERTLSRHAGTMLLNGAYLVERSRGAAFSAAVSALAARHRAQGFELDVTGPWAPYSFVAPAEPADE